MPLSALIKKGGLTGTMTATPATAATHQPDNQATVTTVAVAEMPKPLPELSAEDESNIRAWLAHIEESDPALIAFAL